MQYKSTRDPQLANPLTQDDLRQWLTNTSASRKRCPIQRTISKSIRALRRVLPIAPNDFFAANTRTFKHGWIAHGITVEVLSPQHLAEIAEASEFDPTLHRIEEGVFPDLQGVVAYCHGELAGAALLHTLPVSHSDAIANCRNGWEGMQLAPSTRYLHHLYVARRYRGIRVMSAMLGHVFANQAGSPVSTIITTTNFRNKRFVQSLKSLGFTRARPTINLRRKRSNTPNWPDGFLIPVKARN